MDTSSTVIERSMSQKKKKNQVCSEDHPYLCIESLDLETTFGVNCD